MLDATIRQGSKTPTPRLRPREGAPRQARWHHRHRRRGHRVEAQAQAPHRGRHSRARAASKGLIAAAASPDQAAAVALPKLDALTGDEATGVNIVRLAVSAPLKQMLRTRASRVAWSPTASGLALEKTNKTRCA